MQNLVWELEGKNLSYLTLNEPIFPDEKRINLNLPPRPGFEPSFSSIKGEKCPTAPPHQLIKERLYHETYSKINQIQSEVNKSIWLVELSWSLLFK